MSIVKIETFGNPDSNVYLVMGDRNLLVDTGLGYHPEVMFKSIKKNLDGADLHYVALTHCHVDHIGGLSSIVQEFSPKVLAMEPDASAIRSADPVVTLSKDFGIDLAPSPVDAVHDGDILDLGGRELRFVATPGHTEGGMCIHDDRDKALITGDTLFCPGIGRTDLPTGSLPHLRKSLGKLDGLQFISVYPGHGEPSLYSGRDYLNLGIRLAGE